jgi:hypothetical protein
MVACEGYLRISAHWHLFQYFFKFTCLKEGSCAVMIGCANLRMKQGRDNDYISGTLTSSNSGWHKGWFYLQNEPEFALPLYTGNSIAESRRNWADSPAESALPLYTGNSIAESRRNWAGSPAKKEQEKILKHHWATLGRLRGARVTLAEVIGQYHARGVVPLRRRPLRLCEMTADRPPWEGIVTASSPSPLEVQRHVAQAIGRSTYSWPPSRLLPMLPNAGTEKIVSRHLIDVSYLILS